LSSNLPHSYEISISSHPSIFSIKGEETIHVNGIQFIVDEGWYVKNVGPFKTKNDSIAYYMAVIY
jgi:hypothetical protein